MLCLTALPIATHADSGEPADTLVPVWSLKNNLLYDATLTPNLGVEVKTGAHATAQLFYGLNPWQSSQTKKLRHWSLMPEYRYWLSAEKGPFDGWFTGLHLLAGEYNVAGVSLPFDLFKPLLSRHSEGWYAGGGLTLGHSWRLDGRWRLEAAIGVGYVHTRYDRYVNEVCGDLIAHGHYNYVGPTKLALNLAYDFGRRKAPTEIPVVLPPEPPAPVPDTFLVAYIVPQAEVEKARELSGRAFLDFPVNQTVIRPEYRRNTAELEKVFATINAVRNDDNTSIRHISIHGYASPEGSYANNTRLAEGRAKAFADYIHSLIDVPASLFTVQSTPEDWDGLLAALTAATVAGGSTASTAALIALIQDPTLAPDEKERRMKTRYPAEWKQLLAEVFPALRHSDYVVSYVIRPFTTEEARQLIATKPQQLSLNEMFLVAQTYPAGSTEFNEVFETAVRMFPDDPTANLNAAVTALLRADLAAADRYLLKAGDSPQAQQAREAADRLRQDPTTIVLPE